MSIDVGANLTRIRNERGWTQLELSKRSGVNKATINLIERGHRSPNVHTLERLGRVLGVEAADFLLGDEAVSKKDPDAVKLSERLNRMSAFLEFLPPPESFTTDNALELYEAWERSGVMDKVLKRLEEKHGGEQHPE